MKRLLVLTLSVIFLALAICGCDIKVNISTQETTTSSATTSVENTTKSSIDYKKVTTYELYRNYKKYENQYVQTTIKVTSTPGPISNPTYCFDSFEIDDYDLVSIETELADDDLTTNIGDYLTICGFCSIDTTSVFNCITIHINEATRVDLDKTLFSKLE